MGICCLGIFITGCQLPLANHFRDQVFPQDDTTKIALSPLLFPSYAVLSVVDIVLVNPVRGCANVPKTTETVWNWPEEDTNTKYALMPFKLAAIPIADLGTIMFSEQFLYNDEAPKK